MLIEDYWPPAKRLLGDLKFLERLKKYDRDNVPVRIIDVIRKKYVTDPEFTPANVAKASRCVPGASWPAVGSPVACVVDPRVRALQCFGVCRRVDVTPMCGLD